MPLYSLPLCLRFAAELESLLAESHTQGGPSDFPGGGPPQFAGPSHVGGHLQLGIPGPSHIPIDPSLLPGPHNGHMGLPDFASFSTTPDSMIDPILTGGYGMPQQPQVGALNSLAEAAAQEIQVDSDMPLQVPRPHPIEEVSAVGWPKDLPAPELLRHL